MIFRVTSANCLPTCDMQHAIKEAWPAGANILAEIRQLVLLLYVDGIRLCLAYCSCCPANESHLGQCSLDSVALPSRPDMSMGFACLQTLRECPKSFCWKLPEYWSSDARPSCSKAPLQMISASSSLRSANFMHCTDAESDDGLWCTAAVLSWC